MSTTLIDSYDVKKEDGCTSFMLSGSPHKAAIVGAINEVYPRTQADWDTMIGQKATLMMGGENMMGASAIITEEVTFFRGSSGALAYKTKGARTKGFRFNPAKVLDYVPGYGGHAKLAANLATVVGWMPELVELTQERLLQLPGEQDEMVETTPDCTLAVFGRLRLEETTYRAIWLCHTYLPEDDIVENVLIVPERVGFSEHGSCYGKNLLRAGGEIVGFKAMTFADALDLTNEDHGDVLAKIVAAAKC